jgi:hypothetical protein
MSLQLPEEGTPEYQALLEETGRSDLDGFNYEAHIAATTGPGATPPAPPTPMPPSEPVVAPPSFNPADLPEVPLPPVGSPEYLALLLETGRSNLDGFNYAAHMAVKVGVSNENFDNYIGAESLSDLQRLLGSTDANQFFAQSSGEQIQQLVNKFGSDPAFAAFLQKQTTPGGGTTPINPGQTLPPNPVMNGVVVNTYQAPTMVRNVDTVPLPEFGSVAYKALLLETGRDDLLGFNYGAHLAAKASTSLSNFDDYMNAGSGTALLHMLDQVNVNELMSKASPEQVQQLIGRFASDAAFGAFLDASTTPDLPNAGTPAYEALLASTGRQDLNGFDYQAHLRVLTEAQQAVTSANLKAQALPSAQLVGSASNDRLVYTGQEFVMLAGGEGDDELVAGDHGSLLVPGSGNNTVMGGAALDVVLLSGTLSAANIGQTPEGTWVVQNTLTNNTNLLSGVERLVFEDVSLALDVTPDQVAGQTAMILGAVFGKDAIGKLDYVGIGLELFDQGGNFTDISSLAMSVLNKTSPEDVVGLLWTNVVGSAPTADQARPYIDMLNNGMTQGQLAELAAKTSVNLAQIDLVGLAETGILFI